MEVCVMYGFNKTLKLYFIWKCMFYDFSKNFYLYISFKFSYYLYDFLLFYYYFKLNFSRKIVFIKYTFHIQYILWKIFYQGHCKIMCHMRNIYHGIEWIKKKMKNSRLIYKLEYNLMSIPLIVQKVYLQMNSWNLWTPCPFHRLFEIK
jgi:hypothetical protein